MFFFRVMFVLRSIPEEQFHCFDAFAVSGSGLRHYQTGESSDSEAEMAPPPHETDASVASTK